MSKFTKLGRAEQPLRELKRAFHQDFYTMPWSAIESAEIAIHAINVFEDWLRETFERVEGLEIRKTIRKLIMDGDGLLEAGTPAELQAIWRDHMRRTAARIANDPETSREGWELKHRRMVELDAALMALRLTGSLHSSARNGLDL